MVDITTKISFKELKTYGNGFQLFGEIEIGIQLSSMK
jgi:hypothetical protein